MFYLKKFYYLILKYPLKGLFFSIMSISLIIVFQNEKIISERIDHAFKSEFPPPFFWVLISGKIDLKMFIKKVYQLPGIKEVYVEKSKDLKNRVETTFQELDIEVPETFLSANFTGLKISLQNDLDKRSQGLIREYVIRLIGRDRVSLGPISNPKINKSGQGVLMMKFLKKWGYAVLLFLCFSLWLASYLLMARPIAQYSFLIEKYQRRNSVALKTVAAGLFSMALIVTICDLFFGIPSLFGSISMVMIFSFFSFIITKYKYEYMAN